MQLAWALDEPLQASIDGRTLQGEAMLIPSNARHSVDCRGRVLLAFLEPTAALNALGPQVATNISARHLAQTPPQSPRDFPAWSAHLLEALALPSRPAAPPSEPIRRAQELVLHRLPEVPRLPEAAQAADLAPTTLTHRFTQEVGLPFRRWVLWMRVQLAARLAANGGPTSMTHAAHAAGFSDSAHFTRTFRGLFGLPPSSVLSELELIDSG
ncbi:MAG: helix-turn-helix transcriptional regulator [Polyangiaceae bacterium]|nr:helix-turn-helix transcriptional regulator [Myxococcales bacterium]MCB9588027.1 helix-turn-helix transcriptional regulator [Polyangiaceae bacterium]